MFVSIVENCRGELTVLDTIILEVMPIILTLKIKINLIIEVVFEMGLY